eukprot:739749-Pyramimonas_sp.AAC.1
MMRLILNRLLPLPVAHAFRCHLPFGSLGWSPAWLSCAAHLVCYNFPLSGLFCYLHVACLHIRFISWGACIIEFRVGELVRPV